MWHTLVKSFNYIYYYFISVMFLGGGGGGGHNIYLCMYVFYYNINHIYDTVLND